MEYEDGRDSPPPEAMLHCDDAYTMRSPSRGERSRKNSEVPNSLLALQAQPISLSSDNRVDD